MGEKLNVYFAAPLFTQAEWLWNLNLAQALRELDLDVTLPQSRAEPMLNGEELFNSRILFEANTSGIDEADIVLAVLDQADPDSGTCWECGYAYKAGRRIVGVRTDIRRAGDDPNASVNLMLSQCCDEMLEIPLNKRNDLLWVAHQLANLIHGVMDKK
jgi:nucleoside 2-deoxyribosyltransferase